MKHIGRRIQCWGTYGKPEKTVVRRAEFISKLPRTQSSGNKTDGSCSSNTNTGLWETPRGLVSCVSLY